MPDDAVLSIAVDPSGAERGSQVVRRSLEDISRSASSSMSAVERYNTTLGAGATAADIFQRQTAAMAAQLKVLEDAATANARVVADLGLKFEVIRNAAKSAVSTLLEFGKTKFTGDVTAQMDRLANDMSRAMDAGGKGAVAAARASQREILTIAKAGLADQLELVKQEAQKRVAGAQEEWERVKALHLGARTEIAAQERSAAQQALTDAKKSASELVATAKASNTAVLQEIRTRTEQIITLKQRENAVQAEYERSYDSLTRTQQQADATLTRLLTTEKEHAAQQVAEAQESERLLAVVRRGIQAREAHAVAILAETSAIKEQATVAQQAGRYSVSNTGLVSSTLPALPKVPVPGGREVQQESVDVAALADELDKLVLRYDFASAATARRTEAIDTLRAAQRAGILDDDEEFERLRKLVSGEQQHAVALTALKAEYDGSSAAQKRYAAEIERVTTILDEAKASEADRASILRNVALAFDPTIAATEKAAAENDRLAASYKSVMGSIDPAVAAQQKYETALKQVWDYHMAVHSSTEVMAADMDRVREEMAPAAVEAKKLADDNAKLAASYDRVMASTDPTIAAEQRYEKALAELRAGAVAAGKSMDDLAADEARLTAAMSPAAVAAKREEDALRSMIGGLDKSFFASEKLAQQQALLDRAMTHGVGGIRLNAEQHAALSQAMRDNYEVATRGAASTKLAAHEMMNLSYQIQDVFVSLAGGQNPLMVLVQQGPQATMAVGGLNRAMALLLTPIGLVVTTVAAMAVAVVGIIAAMESYRASINAVNDANRIMGDVTGLSRGRLEDLAGSMNKISTRDAREVETAFIRVGNVIGTQFTDAMAITHDFARVTGQDVPEAAKSLAELLKDPAKGAEVLRDSYRALTAAQAEYVQRLAAQGETGKAQQVQLDALKAKYQDFADEGVGYVERSYRFLKNAASDAWDAMGKIGAPKTTEDDIRALEERLQRIAQRFQQVKGRTATDADIRAAGGGQILDDLGAARDKKGAADAVVSVRAQTAEMESRRTAGLSLSKQVDTEIGQQNALEDQYKALSRAVDAYRSQIDALGQGEGRASAELAQVRASYAQVAEAADRAKNAKESYLTATDRLVQQDKIANTYAAQYGQIADRNRARDQAWLETAGQKLTTAERQQKADSAVTQVIAQQTAAVTAQVASFDSNAASLDLLTAAYGRNAVAVKEAELQQKIAQATLGMAPDLAAKVAAGITAQEEAQRRLNTAQADFDLRNQIDAATRLAQAEGVSGAAVADANIQNRVRAQILKEGVGLESERAQAIDAGTRALEAQNAAARVNSSIRNQNQDLTIAKAEYDLLGASNAERERQVAILKATLEVQNSGDWAQVPKETRDAWIVQAGAVAEYQSRIADATETSRDFANTITKGFEDAVLSGGKLTDIVKSLGKDIERIFLRATVTKPLENWLSGSMTKLLSPAPANDNMVKPVNDNDPGGYRAAFERLAGNGSDSLGSSASNAMWVQMTAGSAAFDVGAIANGSALPVAIKDGGSITDLIRAEARAQGVPEEVALSIAKIESGFRQFRADGSVLKSSAGAQGVMQLMPDTAKWLGVDATDTRDNIRGGVKFLSMLGRQFGGDWNAVAGAYNAGPSRMTANLETGRSLPAETVSYVEKFGASVKTVGADVLALRDPVQGVTAAQERQLQAQIDALPVLRAVNDSTETLTSTQRSWVDSALGLTAATDTAGTSIAVTARAMDTVPENAISAAEGFDAAATGIGSLGEAATEGADTLLGGIKSIASGIGDFFDDLFSGSSASQAQKVIKNADGSTSFTPSSQGVGGSWLSQPAITWGGGPTSRQMEGIDDVGQLGYAPGTNPASSTSWGQVIQGVGGIAAGVTTATQKGATTGQQIGGGLTAAGGIAAMIPGGQIVGGVMMAAGALLSAVTGAKDRGTAYSRSNITLGSNGKYGLGSYDADNGGNPTQFNADASKIAKGLNDIAARLNLTPTTGASYIDSKNKSAEEAAVELLKGMQSSVPNVAYALAHETAVSLEDMLEHLEFANSFDQQIKALRSSVSDLFAQFQSGVDAANSFGKSISDIIDNAFTVFAVPKGASLPGFATGTLSAPAGWAVVGEEGPEVVRLHGGERIWNARESAQMLADQGIGPDTELVHVRPDELAWMHQTLGGGRINPITGLPMFLEGDSGGVGDTGGGGHSGGGGNSNGAGPMGGENAATGSAYGSTSERDAAYGGGGSGSGGGGIGDTIAGWLSVIGGVLAPLGGWVADNEDNAAAQASVLSGVAGLGMAAVATALSAVASEVGPGLTGLIEGITGEKGTAPAVGHDYGDQGEGGVSGTAGTIGERAVASAGSGSYRGASADVIDNTLAALADAIKADPTGSLTTDLVASSRVGGPQNATVQQIADTPWKIFAGSQDDPLGALAELDTAAQQLLSATGQIPDVLRRALDGANAYAVSLGITPATTTRQIEQEQAQQRADALQTQFDGVGITKSRLAELNGIVKSLGDDTFSPIGKDFDALAADMGRAATAYTAAGQAVPDGLFAAQRQMETLGAARKRLLDEVAGTTIETSPEQQKVEQLRGQWSATATDLVKAFAQVGIVGDDLAARLNEGFGNALRKEQKSYSETSATTLRKVRGEDGYDSAVALADSYETAISDVNALWSEGADRARETGVVTATLGESLLALVKSGSVTSKSLTELQAVYANQPAVLAAVTTALGDLTAAAARQQAVTIRGATTTFETALDSSYKPPLTAATALADAGVTSDLGGFTSDLNNFTAALARGAAGAADARFIFNQLTSQFQTSKITGDEYNALVGSISQGWTTAANAAQTLAASARASEDQTVRSLRAQGMTAQADDYAQALDRQREMQDAITNGYDAAYIAGLRYILAIEAANAATEKRAAIEAANADIYNRALTAVGNTVQAAANAFDLTATQKRKEAIATGLSGQDLANLDAVLAAERGQTVFQAAHQSVLDWYDREISAKSELVTSIQDGALKIAQAAKQFQQAADSIRLSEDAPISPQERLTEAKRQWDAALGTINSSTATDSEKDTARSALTSLGQTLVSIEKTNSAGTADTLYKEVLKTFDGLGDLSALGDGVATAEADLKVAQDSLKELQKARADAANYGQRTVGNLENLHATMVAANDNYLTAINGLSSMLSQTKPVAPDKGGTTAAQQAGKWMTDWFTEYDKYAAESGAGHLSEAEWQRQGAALWQSKVDKTNSLPLDPLVWNAFIQAAASASAGADTAAWLRQIAHDKGVPGYAVGTMATPPGAIWVGERGPELMWQDGGASVASSADSMRIAGLWQSAANDRWSGNVSSFQPLAPARPVSSDGSAAIVAELRRLNAQIAELKQGLRDAEGDAQDQRDVLLTKLIRAVESMKAQLADLKPGRAA